jgi:hypothetical protein
MASDKLKDGFPIPVIFGAGEQPADTKLNSWATQTQNALQALEQAVGDIFDQSKALGGSDRLSNRDLQIANIGRLIGPASMLNPQVLHDLRISDYEYTIPVGVKEFVLPHPPLVSGSPSTIDWDGSFRFSDEKSSVEDLSDVGDFYVDYTTGRVFTYSATQAGDIAIYDYDSIGDSFDNASFNVIPDPNQSSERCEVSYSGGQYYIDLPFIKYDQEGALATDGSDPNYSDVTGLHNTLKAQLPSFLTVLDEGDIVPNGFVYLFDHNTNTIVDGAVFTYVSQTRLRVSNIQPEEGSSRYSLLTIGAPLTEIVYALRKKQREHIHDGSNGGERIAHGNLTGNIHEDYVPSAIDSNQHPQYLLRNGYVSGSDANNSDNALRGDLLIGSSVPSGNDYANITADSKKLYFGSLSGPALQYNQTYDALSLAAKDLMANGNLTVGKSSAVDSNTSYLGFGQDPSNNHLVLDEANAAGSRFRFLIDGDTAGADVEAGNFIAIGSSPQRYYFGDKTGTNDSYIERDGTQFSVAVDDDIANSDFRVGSLRLKSNFLYFNENVANNDYIYFNDTSDSYDFYAGGAREDAIITAGEFVSVGDDLYYGTEQGGYYFGEKSLGDRLVKDTGRTFFFDKNHSNSESTVYMGRLVCTEGGVTDWLNGARVRDLVDGGNTTLHRHSYTYRYDRWAEGMIWTDGTDDITRYVNVGWQPHIVAFRGAGIFSGQSGTWGNNSFYFYKYSSGIAFRVEQSDDNYYTFYSAFRLESTTYNTY